MNVKKTSLLEDELDYYLSGFENRLNEVGQPKLTLHTSVAKDIFSDLKAANKAKKKKIYGELMQLEEIARKIAAKRAKEFPEAKDQSEVPDDSVVLLRRICELKGIVNLVCITLIPFMSVTPIPRRANSSRIKVERIEMGGKTWK